MKRTFNQVGSITVGKSTRILQLEHCVDGQAIDTRYAVETTVDGIPILVNREETKVTHAATLADRWDLYMNYSDDPTIYANAQGYSDVTPYEVIRIVNEKVMIVRQLKCTRDPSWKPEVIPGGFAGHVVNDREQRWIIESDPDGTEVTIRRRSDLRWKSTSGQRFSITPQPVKFYDHNF